MPIFIPMNVLKLMSMILIVEMKALLNVIIVKEPLRDYLVMHILVYCAQNNPPHGKTITILSYFLLKFSLREYNEELNIFK